MKNLHPRNIHNEDYDLEKLIHNHSDLAEYIVEKYGKQTIDFKNPKAVKALNKALLLTHYGVKYWDFPDENLCPPIPGRVDYIHHISDLIGQENARVLDIGTGATCIYPLLGNAVYDWTFVGMDIDQKSLATAQNIINENDLQDNITFRLQKNSKHILEGVLQENDRFDVSICNPPFYKSIGEANAKNQRKNQTTKSTERNFSGKNTELIYEGGEHRFLNTYLYESSFHREKCRWFTSLVSRKEGVKTLEKSAEKLNFDEFKIIPMQQGNKITRIVCWA